MSRRPTTIITSQIPLCSAGRHPLFCSKDQRHMCHLKHSWSFERIAIKSKQFFFGINGRHSWYRMKRTSSYFKKKSDMLITTMLYVVTPCSDRAIRPNYASSPSDRVFISTDDSVVDRKTREEGSSWHH
ncbi:hypothetical protein QTP88_018127 [Uroleucon formosanum]